MAIDLRQSLKDMIYGSGTDKGCGVKILYVRDSKYIRCKCYNELYKTGDTNCKICNGFGMVTTIESAKVFYDNNYMRPGTAENQGFGLISEDIVFLYSTHDLKPNPKDRIYITVWVQDLPIEIKKVFIISNVDEMRCDNGRIEGYMITGKLRADLTSNANSSLKSLPLKAKKIISRGGKYVWPYSKT